MGTGLGASRFWFGQLVSLQEMPDRGESDMSAAGPGNPLTAAEGRTVATLVAVFSVVYGLYGVFRHRSFHSSYDLGIFDQALESSPFLVETLYGS